MPAVTTRVILRIAHAVEYGKDILILNGSSGCSDSHTATQGDV
jgi:hypothetical protein